MRTNQIRHTRECWKLGQLFKTLLLYLNVFSRKSMNTNGNKSKKNCEDSKDKKKTKTWPLSCPIILFTYQKSYNNHNKIRQKNQSFTSISWVNNKMILKKKRLSSSLICSTKKSIEDKQPRRRKQKNQEEIVKEIKKLKKT